MTGPTIRDLVPISTKVVGTATIDTVNARDLHVFLENGDHFTQWIRDRIRQYGFAEGVDFITYSESSEKGAPRIEYAITLDMGKELGMVERNARGKQVRLYFIECERRAKLQVPNPTEIGLPDFTVPHKAARAWAEQAERAEVAEQQLIDAAPKVEAYETLMHADGAVNLRTAMRTIGAKPQKAIDALKAKSILFYEAGSLQPAATYRDRGFFVVKARNDPSGTLRSQTLVTPKGLDWLRTQLPHGVFAAPAPTLPFKLNSQTNPYQSRRTYP